MSQPLRILSLGAGVQSTTVALMSAYGDLPKLDCAIFSDTGWEPQEVYEHLGRLEVELAKHDIPVRRVSAGNIRDDHVDPKGEHLFIRKPRKHPEYLGKQRTFIPVYIKTAKGGGRLLGDTEEWEPGMTRRTCTKTYKIEPVEKEIRALLGLKPRQRWPLELAVEQWFGISWDEAHRMSDPTRPAIAHHYPLVDMRMDRAGCHKWMLAHGWSAPRSACIGCPFHSDDEWRRMRDKHPEDWADAIEFDRVFRDRQQADLLPMEGRPYLHAQRVPLDEVDLEHPQDDMDVFDLFGEECSGFCGT